MKGGDYRFKVLGNDRWKSARRRLGSAAAAFPMLDGIQAKAKGIGKFGLGYVQSFAEYSLRQSPQAP